MELLNDLTEQKAQLTKDSIEKILVSLSIIAPHMASELLEQLLQKPLYLCAWPSYDPVMLTEDKVTMVVQVNGKLRGNITVKHGLNKDEVEEAAKSLGIPIAWNLAGGYQEDKSGGIQAVLDIHNNTMIECVAAYAICDARTIY